MFYVGSNPFCVLLRVNSGSDLVAEYSCEGIPAKTEAVSVVAMFLDPPLFEPTR